jgi:hypothetical protein
MSQGFRRQLELRTTGAPISFEYAASSNSRPHHQVPHRQRMHQEPARASHARENAKKDRSCGKQVLTAITTWFRSDGPPVQQPPTVPLRDISPLFARLTDHKATPRLQRPKTIPIKSLHDIVPLFGPPRDHEVRHTTLRSQIAYPFPTTRDRVSMPQLPKAAKVKQRWSFLYYYDSSQESADRADLEPHFGGLAEKYHRPGSDAFSEAPMEAASDNGSIPMVRPAGRRRIVSDCSSVGEVESIPVVQLASPRRALSDCSSDSDSDSWDGSEAAFESEWEDRERDLFSTSNSFRSKHLVTADRRLALTLYMGQREGPTRRPRVVEAATLESVAAELSWALESEDDHEDEVVQSLRRDSLSVYAAFQAAHEVDVDDHVNAGLLCVNAIEQEPTGYVDLDDILCVEDTGWLEAFQEWSALLRAGNDQACLARFAHLWEDSYAEPIDHSLFADFDGDFSKNLIEESS